MIFTFFSLPNEPIIPPLSTASFSKKEMYLEYGICSTPATSFDLCMKVVAVSGLSSRLEL